MRSAEVDALNPGTVLDAARERQDAALQGEVRPRHDRTEGLERDLLQLHHGVHAGKRLREEVGVAVDRPAPAFENARGRVDRRWVDAVLRVDVADVLRLHVEVGQLEGVFRVRVDVRHRRVPDEEAVDLEGIDLFHRLLPAPLLDRRRIRRLGAQLRQVEIDARPVEDEVRDELQGEKLLPLDARVEPRELEHGRFGVGLLPQDQVLESQRQVDRVESEALDPDGIALEAPVHAALHRPAQGLVDEEQGDDEEDENARQDEKDRAGTPRPRVGEAGPRLPFRTRSEHRARHGNREGNDRARKRPARELQ